MALFRKVRKLVWLLKNVNISQTFYLHSRATIPRGGHVYVHHYSLLNISDSARITVTERGYLDINLLNIKRNRIRPCTLWMSNGSLLKCEGFSMYEGAAVVLLENAVLSVGHGTYMNESLIQCSTSITIGNECAIAGDVLIQDTDFHPMLDEGGNEKPFSKPIVIGNKVWICAKATILKGVTIGDGAVIADRAVVSKYVTDHTLVGCNPARGI